MRRTHFLLVALAIVSLLAAAVATRTDAQAANTDEITRRWCSHHGHRVLPACRAFLANTSTTTTTRKPTTTTKPAPPGSPNESTTTTTTTTAPPQSPPPSGQFLPVSAPGKGWTSSFTENFDGPGHKMATSADWNGGKGTYSFNGGREWYDPCQVTVSGGTAKLQAEPVGSANCTNANRTGSPASGAQEGYLSGYVGTNRKLNQVGEPYVYAYTYGYAEARLKLPPQTPGFFSAFWTLDANCVNKFCQTFDYSNEIDILEVLGNDASTMWQTSHTKPDRQVTYSDAWFPGTDGDMNGNCPFKRYDDAFHTFGMDWEPAFIAFYIDGKKCGQVSNGYVNPNKSEPQTAFVSPSTPQYLIINLFVDHGWETSWGSHVTPTNGVWPSRTLEVDYLRVFQQK